MRRGYREIPGFPGYWVNQRGTQVRSQHTRSWHRLKPKLAKDGYLEVSLSKGGRQYFRKVHTLVLIAFKGPRPKGAQCRHLDGNKLNNADSNVAWGTAAENYADQVRHGTNTRGDKVHTCKLTAAEVVEIRRRHKCGHPVPLVARAFCISKSQAYRIVARKAWKHVPEAA